MKYLRRTGILASVVIMLMTVVPVDSLGALSNRGPSPNDFSPANSGDQFGYVVTSSDSSYTRVPRTQVNLYFTNNTGNKRIEIVNADLCSDPISTGGNHRDRPDIIVGNGFAHEGTHWSDGDRVTHYVARSGNQDLAATDSVISPSNTCYRNYRTLTIPGNRLAFDADSGYYLARLIATSYGGFHEMMNQFNVRLTDPGAIVGYDSQLASSSFSVARDNPLSGYRTYSLPFGPDCTLTGPGTAQAQWYDDDNGDNEIQPQDIWMYVQEYRGNTFVQRVPLSFSGQSSRRNGPISNSYYVYSGNQGTVNMRFTARPGYRYIWKWEHVYWQNRLQFRLPFDSIFYLSGCQRDPATLRPVSQVDKASMSYPDTATFTHSIDVDQYTSPGSVSYVVQRLRDGAVISSSPPRTYNFNSGGAPVPVATTIFNSTAADAGHRICERLVLSNPNPPNTRLEDNPSNQACVTIAKIPYVHFMGNDVWAGGGFGGPTSTCNGQAKIQTVGHTLPDGSRAGSVGEYGTFALGRITGFGSASQPLSGTAGRALTFANLPPNFGNFGAARHCMDDHIADFSATATNTAPGAYNVTDRGSGVWRIPGNAQFSGAMPAGASQVYIVDGDATITGDITYPATHANQTAIPSFILLVRGNLTIQSGVRQINGMLVSRGQLNTCDPPPGNLSSSICNQQLVINGPVVTQRLNLLRTFGGAGNTSAERRQPAEIFNFSPEFYLRNALPGGGIWVVDQRDLPPRF